MRRNPAGAIPPQQPSSRLTFGSQFRAATILFLLAINLVVWATPLLLVALAKVFVRKGKLRNRILGILTGLAERWVAWNDRIFDALLDTRWEISGDLDLDAGGHYLVVANHQSWLDIFAILRTFHRRTPFVRFFLKQNLIWVPILGLAWWALEFPFMRRYSAEYLERHPEKRGVDIATTRRACRRYLSIPVAVMIFLEGTRFTPEKQAQQRSPYRHLLRPRAGALAHALATMGDALDSLLDVTIAYPGAEGDLWRFLRNGVPVVSVRVRQIPIEPAHCDEATTEPGPARDRLKSWIEGLWEEKDEMIERC